MFLFCPVPYLLLKICGKLTDQNLPTIATHNVFVNREKTEIVNLTLKGQRSMASNSLFFILLLPGSRRKSLAEYNITAGGERVLNGTLRHFFLNILLYICSIRRFVV